MIVPIGGSEEQLQLLPAVARLQRHVTNPTGTRCGDPDLAASVWGTTTSLPGGASKRAHCTTTDNVGVQYGLKALLAGTINARRVRDA